MLLNDFYTILTSSKEEDVVTATVEFNSSHAIFKGHFPQTPVVPGVCQTQMLSEVLNTFLEKKVQLKKATNIKFLNFVSPNHTPKLNLHIKIDKGENEVLTVTAHYVWEQLTFFKFKGEFC